MAYTFLSASYSNNENTAAVVETVEAGAIVVSQADMPALWDELLAAVVPSPYQEPSQPPARTYKADVWRRATDGEAATIDAQINAQPVKLRNLFRDCDFLNHADPYFAQLKAGFAAAFGQARADELLAPSA